MHTLFLTTAILFLSTLSYSQSLWLIKDQGYFGYMNNNGAVIIEPRFINADNFSEGLAPARDEGLFGYIDSSGSYHIPPVYDFAESFSGGMARVYHNGKAFYIDKDGNPLFNSQYHTLRPFGQAGGFIAHQDDSVCITDASGRPVSDWYQAIHSDINGTAIFQKVIEGDTDNKTTLFGLVNANGQIVLPSNECSAIQTFGDHFLVSSRDDREIVVNKAGTKLFTIPEKKYDLPYDNEGFHEGLAIVNIWDVDRDTIKRWSSADRHTHAGAIDESGRVVFENKEWKEITPFHEGYAFATDYDRKRYLINRSGQKVLNESIYVLDETGYNYPRVTDGKFLAETYEGLAMMDTSGRVLYSLETEDFDYANRYKDMVILTYESTDNGFVILYGLWNPETDTHIKPAYTAFPVVKPNPGGEEIFMLAGDNSLKMINRHGHTLYSSVPHSPGGWNIDYMRRTDYHASSPSGEKYDGLGGWGGSDNKSFRVKDKAGFSAKDLHLAVRKGEEPGTLNVFLVNNSGERKVFEAQDSRIYLKMQAKDVQGNWKDIEYIPSSWCGNSYHSVYLDHGYSWKFTAPMYEGAFKTELRLALLNVRSDDDEDEESQSIYSVSFAGSINPAQFWRKPGYMPGGIMDPYNE